MKTGAEPPPAASEALAVCVWCLEHIPEGVIPVVIARCQLHPHCADQLDEWFDSDREGWDECLSDGRFGSLGAQD